VTAVFVNAPIVPAPARAGRLPAGRLAAFSALALPIAAAQMPLNVYLPAIYSQHFGLSLGLVGLIFFVEKLWGAAADPVVGALSDRTRTRYGRRRPWILAGAGVFGLAGLILFFPVFGVTPAYLAVGLFAFYLGWSMMQIPYLAWSGEISGDYHERTRVVAFQAVISASALLLVLVLPTLVDRFRPGAAELKLNLMGLVILASLVPAVALALRAFPEPAPRPAPATKLGLRAAARLLLADALLTRVLLSDFAVTLGQSIRGALFIFFVSFYVGLPQWASGLFLLQFVFGVTAAPIWTWIGRRLGKHRAAVAGELAQVVINLGLLLVGRGDVALLVGLTIAQGLAQGSGNLMLRAMVADVADAHLLKTGEDRAALFFSVFSISMKAAAAVAVGLALPLVAWLGFDPGARNTPEALHGLQLVFALGPAVAHLVSAALVAGFPLDEAAHAEVRRQLTAGRASRSSASPTAVT
jgi:GPH family glycoside/pentoside/hexuronide:cation symporter